MFNFYLGITVKSKKCSGEHFFFFSNFLIFYFFLSLDGGYVDNEGKQWGFALNKRDACCGGMTFEDGAVCGQVKLTAASGIDIDGFLHCHLTLLQERLLAIIDECGALRIVGEYLMSGFRGIKDNIGIVNDIELLVLPGSGQVPRIHVFICDGDNATHAENLEEVFILLLQNDTTLLNNRLNALRSVQLLHKSIGISIRLLKLALDGLMGNQVKHFTNATVLFRRVVPSVNAVHAVQPLGHGSLRIEELPGLNSGATLGINGAVVSRPVLHRRGMMVNALNGKDTTREPHVTSRLRNRNVHKQNVIVAHRVHLRPRVGLTRSNGVLTNGAELGNHGVSNVARHPAVNAIAVEKNGELGLGLER